jgi:hypothetical protein
MILANCIFYKLIHGIMGNSGIIRNYGFWGKWYILGMAHSCRGTQNG